MGKRKIDQQLEDLVEELIKRLKEEGFTIHRYNSYTTNSIYLKLDWGACNSIRISDHPGKEHLAYRFNIGTYIPAREMTFHKKSGYPQFWFPENMVGKLVSKIVEVRAKKLEDRGEQYYLNQMAYHRKQSKQGVGFWRSARKVNTGVREKMLKPDKKYEFKHDDSPKPDMSEYTGYGLPVY